jgi:hypothetical protein
LQPVLWLSWLSFTIHDLILSYDYFMFLWNLNLRCLWIFWTVLGPCVWPLRMNMYYILVFYSPVASRFFALSNHEYCLIWFWWCCVPAFIWNLMLQYSRIVTNIYDVEFLKSLHIALLFVILKIHAFIFNLLKMFCTSLWSILNWNIEWNWHIFCIDLWLSIHWFLAMYEMSCKLFNIR